MILQNIHAADYNAIYLVADNKVKAGQLPIMEALLESLTLHKANEKVVEAVAGAVSNICVNGISFAQMGSCFAASYRSVRFLSGVFVRASFT